MKENLAFCEERIPDEELIRETAKIIVEKIECFFDRMDKLKKEEEMYPILIEEFRMASITLIKRHPDRLVECQHFMEIDLSPEALCWIDFSMKVVKDMLKNKYKVIKIKEKKESSPQSWMIRRKNRKV